MKLFTQKRPSVRYPKLQAAVTVNVFLKGTVPAVVRADIGVTECLALTFRKTSKPKVTGIQKWQNTHESQNAVKSPPQNCRSSARIMTEIRIQILRAPKARAEVFEGVHT